MSRFQKLSLGATTTTLLLIGVGGLVRATGSGLGCPAWPRCYGRWIPPLEYHALIEYSHRFVAAVAVALVGVVALVAWRRHRHERRITAPATTAVLLVFAQAGLGGIVVGNELDATLVTLHFAVAMALLATLVVLSVNSLTPGRSPRLDVVGGRLAVSLGAATGLLLLAGAYVRGRGAGLAFPDWPLMNGKAIPRMGVLATPHFIHRVLTLGVGILVGALAWRVRRERSITRTLTFVAVGIYLAQALVGAANVWSDLASPAQVAHVQLAAALWATVIALVALRRRDPVAEPEAAVAEKVRAYLQLTKPRIIMLLLVTTVPAMIVADHGFPSAWLIAATLIGGTIAAGGANTINCYLDRDIDEVMRRTRGRPLPTHRISAPGALWFGVSLSAISFVWLWATVNLLSAALAVSAVLFYVFAYTMVLKRSTPQNIVIGGAAGAVPCLVGWAATTGRLGASAMVLFGIVFFWTPPHFWALAIRHVNDYRAAGVPMLPAVRGHAETARHIVFYSVVLFVATMLLIPVARMGLIYAVAAVVLGGAFVYQALRLRKDASGRAAFALFRYSITYLALLFASMAADRLIRVA